MTHRVETHRVDWREVYRQVRNQIDSHRRYRLEEVAILLGLKKEILGLYITKDELPAVKLRKGDPQWSRGAWAIRGHDLLVFLREKAYFASPPKAA